MGAGKFSANSGTRRRVEAELVGRLRRLPVGELPDERFKAELRAQLVAIAPRIVSESAPVSAPSPTRPRRAGSRRLVLLHRPLLAVTGAAAVLVLLLSLAVWMADGALPGQSLYGIKRASENFQLSVTGSDVSKGQKYLKFAGSRASESSKLAGSGPASPHAALLVAKTLRAADSDTRNGARLLTGAAVSGVSADPLAKITSWLGPQWARIAALAPKLPAGPARSQAAASLTLLQQLATRVSQLKAELGCTCLSTTHADALGPLPCPSCGVRSPNAPGLPGDPGGPGGGTSGLPSLPTGPPSSIGSPVPTTPSLPGLGGSGGALPSGPPGGSGLPSGVPSSPVAVGSGGISVGIPGLSISAGPGGVGVVITPPTRP
jgi:Domain of unknown function (DUF5667)